MDAALCTYNHYRPIKKSRKNNHYAHNRNELKCIYNAIVRLGKESPICTFDSSVRTYDFAVGIKELVGNLKDSLNILTNRTDPDTIKRNQVAVSSEPDTATVTFLSYACDAEAAEEFGLQIIRLASTQINTGAFLPDSRVRLSPGSYSFDIEIKQLCYGFQFEITRTETHRSLQSKLAALINRAHIGIHADVIKDEARNSTALQLESLVTGRPVDNSAVMFQVADDPHSALTGIVKYLNLDHVVQYPEDACYYADSKQYHSSSNTVVINEAFEITFHKTTSADTTLMIGFRTNLDAISDSIRNVSDTYNSILDFTDLYSAEQQRSILLYKHISSVSTRSKNALDSIGLTVLETGRLFIDEHLLYQALTEDMPDTLLTLNQFKTSLIKVCDDVLLNPMNYVNRTIILYPNPGKTCSNPYRPSNYSGMLFNGYC